MTKFPKKHQSWLLGDSWNSLVFKEQFSNQFWRVSAVPLIHLLSDDFFFFPNMNSLLASFSCFGSDGS